MLFIEAEYHREAGNDPSVICLDTFTTNPRKARQFALPSLDAFRFPERGGRSRGRNSLFVSLGDRAPPILLLASTFPDPRKPWRVHLPNQVVLRFREAGSWNPRRFPREPMRYRKHPPEELCATIHRSFQRSPRPAAGDGSLQ